jgi:hypothetical protein
MNWTLLFFVVLVLLFGPIFVLRFRSRRFRWLAHAYNTKETEIMAHLSSMALRVYVVLFILYCVVSNVAQHFGQPEFAEWAFLAIWTSGLVTALVLDYQAGKIRRGLGFSKQKIKILQSEGKTILKEQKQPQKQFEAAVKLEAKGNYDEAIVVYRSIIEKWPSTEAARDSQASIDAIDKRRAEAAGKPA